MQNVGGPSSLLDSKVVQVKLSKLPKAGRYKFNGDATFSTWDDRLSTFGVIELLSSGKFEVNCYFNTFEDQPSTSEHAEVLTCLNAVKLAKNRGLSIVEIGSDNSNTVKNAENEPTKIRTHKELYEFVFFENSLLFFGDINNFSNG